MGVALHEKLEAQKTWTENISPAQTLAAALQRNLEGYEGRRRRGIGREGV